MAENKMGANIGAGAGIFAKRVQKSLSRAQEKVMQKLGKTMETKDEQFEQCSQNINKQQMDGNRLSKDVKAYFNAVKVMHETSRRLSQTLKEVYEPDWEGEEDLNVIMESEDLLWNDYEEKLMDQIVRTMDNYTGQFPEVKERVSKRGRKLVDYDSSRHHLEALQNAKKKDDSKIAKAEEEFNKAQSVFEEINAELREELPALYQSRIGCYVTVFQNLSNLRDVFYKEMSGLNKDLYNVTKRLETQHSGQTFIIKGLNSTKPKKRRSLLISAPIPCNTAFPSDHTALHASSSSGPESLAHARDAKAPEPSDSGSSSSGSTAPTPKRRSLIDDELAPDMPLQNNPDETLGPVQAPNPSAQEEPGQRSESGEEGEEENGDGRPELTSSESKESVSDPSVNVEPKAAPAPDPRVSLPALGGQKLLPSEEEDSEGEGGGGTPPCFLYKGLALESQEEEGLLQFQKGDVILVLDDDEDKPEGVVVGVKEQSWLQQGDLAQHCGIVMKNRIQPVESM